MIVDCGQRHLADLCLLRNVRVEGWSRINAWATLTTYNIVCVALASLHPWVCLCRKAWFTACALNEDQEVKLVRNPALTKGKRVRHGVSAKGHHHSVVPARLRG